jgi:hypothetical protein
MQELDAMTMDNGIRNTQVDNATRSTRVMEQKTLGGNEISDGLRNSRTME